MSNSQTYKGSGLKAVGELQGERLVYVMPEHAFGSPNQDEIDLFALWNIFWQGKWLVIGTTVLCSLVSVMIALMMTEWYRAEVLLAPSDERATPSITGQLGGLAALAGVSVGGGGSAEAIAVLRSRDFAREFIDEFQLLPVFFADDWNAEHGEWRIPNEQNWPDERDAIKFFHKYVMSVSEARDSGMVRLVIEWTEPVVAAQWAMALVERLNQRLRERALSEAEANVAYLQAELAQTNVVTLQQTVGRLLESELQKLMLARGNEEFAFRIVDSADIPKERSRPRRTLIAILGTTLGGMLGIILAFSRHLVEKRKLANPSSL